MNREVANELRRIAKMVKATGNKRYRTQYGIGKTKYSVSYHDGVQTHKDGSPFYGIALFSSKKAEQLFINSLEKQGYRPDKLYV